MTHKIFKTTDLVELFNLAYLGVIEQGKPSVVPNAHEFDCAYHGENGEKCGIGHCLTNEALEKVGSFIGDVSAMLGEFDYDDGFTDFEEFNRSNDFDTFLMGLQQCHDKAEIEVGNNADSLFIAQFKQNMMQFAIKTFPKRTFDVNHGIL